MEYPLRISMSGHSDASSCRARNQVVFTALRMSLAPFKARVSAPSMSILMKSGTPKSSRRTVCTTRPVFDNLHIANAIDFEVPAKIIGVETTGFEGNDLATIADQSRKQKRVIARMG